MAGLVLCIALQVVGAGKDSAVTYEEAYRQSQANGQPLVVLVGTDWCPACQTMKKGVLARMLLSGKLSRVNFAVVNADREKELAGKLMRGNSIPQLIVFHKTGEKSWTREQITGAASEDNVLAMIEKADALTAKNESAEGATSTR